MRKSRPASLTNLVFFALLGALFPGSLRAQELLKNGDFETGRLPPWSATQVAGTSVALVAENSPFSAGTSAVRLKDDDSDFEEPSLRQSFEAHDLVLFGFDFKVPTPGDASPWYVAWEGENATTAFFFSLGGADGLSIEFNQGKIADLKPNVWYHVEGSADAPQQKVTGTLQNSVGEKANFEGTFPFGVKSVLNGIVVSDGDAARNPDVLLDNFFSRAVSLTIARNGMGETVLTWAASGFTLQSTTSLGSQAAWTNVPSASGAYTNTFPENARFFRLAE